MPLTAPTDQSRAVWSILEEHDPPLSVLASFDEDLANLNSQASSNQFEQALAHSGRYLGFAAQRPEKTDRIGPDVLWLAQGRGFVLEAKSRKFEKNKVAKDDVKQLLTAGTWFETKYPGVPYTHAIVAPNPTAETNFEPGSCQVLSMSKLIEMVAALRALYEEVAKRSEATSSLSPADRRCTSVQQLFAQIVLPDILFRFQ